MYSFSWKFDHFSKMSTPKSHPAGRPLSTDWSINSFVMVVCEKNFESSFWPENSDWTLKQFSHLQPLLNYYWTRYGHAGCNYLQHPMWNFTRTRPICGNMFWVACWQYQLAELFAERFVILTQYISLNIRLGLHLTVLEQKAFMCTLCV